MKHWIAALVLMLAGVFAPRAEAYEEVILCGNCTSEWQFQAAAAGGVEGGPHAEFTTLVINPNTAAASYVHVIYTPPGMDPRRNPSPVDALSLDKAAEDRGVFSLRGNSQNSIVYVSEKKDAEFARIQSQTWISSWSPSADELAEIGALIDVGKNSYVIVLPPSPFFASFSQREPAAVANKLYAEMAEKPGWVKQALANRIRMRLPSLLASFFGKPYQVCAIFNNGDSACFKPDVNAPSLENLVAGSARDANGQPVGGGGGGGGGEGMIVHNDPPGTWYGWPGSSGGAGEVWLVCSGGDCYIVIL